MESSHRWTFVRYFGTQQVPIGMPGRTDGQGKNNMSPPEGGRHNNVGVHEAYLMQSVLTLGSTKCEV